MFIYFVYWVVRESVRKSLKREMKFNSREDLLDAAQKVSKIKYDFDSSGILNRSKLLKQIKEEKRLGEWF